MCVCHCCHRFVERWIEKKAQDDARMQQLEEEQAARVAGSSSTGEPDS